MISNLRELRRLLRSLNIDPKRSLSQNFLIDVSVIDKLIHAAQIKKTTPVCEIGPGAGAITEKLLEKSDDVCAIELDTVFAKHHRAHDLTVFETDALHFDYHQLKTHTKIVANLPYHIATPLITKLIQLFPQIESLTLILQKEVADRLCAHPSTKAYGALTIQTQLFANPTYLFTIEPSAFYPPPKVKSAAIHLQLHKKKSDLDIDFVFNAFRNKRKMLKKNLKETYPKIADWMQELNIDLNARAENLTFEQFSNLWKKINSKNR